jgi:hypothetical protein
MSVFYVNATLEIELKVRKRDGSLYTPAGVRLRMTTPNEATTTYVWGTNSELLQARDSNNAVIPGTFIFTYTPTQSGRHSYIFETYGDINSAIKNMFNVEKN